MNRFTLGIVGAGNMATAILNGILKSGCLNPDEIIVSDVDGDKLKAISEKGVVVTFDNELIFGQSDYILLAVKPQVAKEVFKDIKYKNLKVISIMAGISRNTVSEMFGGARVARIRPNTPCLVGKGMCAIDAGDFDEDGRKLVSVIFSSLGKIVELDEKYFDAVTAVSGSGPAYVYTFIKAMIDEGDALGLDEKISETLTLQTFEGAVKMVEERTTDIDTLIKNVCSKGGTTIEAVNCFAENNLDKIIAEGMKRCEKRSKELSGNV